MRLGMHPKPIQLLMHRWPDSTSLANGHQPNAIVHRHQSPAAPSR